VVDPVASAAGEGTPMTGADLKCPTCGAGAIDVAPEFELDPVALDLLPSKSWGISWHCASGHAWISGVRSKRGFEHMSIGGR
jgi:hypothetical protein